MKLFTMPASLAEKPVRRWFWSCTAPLVLMKPNAKRRGFPRTVQAVSVLTALAVFVGAGQAAWMKTANYNDPVIRQQHFDLGLSYAGTVVHLMLGNRWKGSAVVINNPRCIAMAAHQFEEAGAFLDPTVDDLYIRTGPNYLTNAGSSVRISQIIRHPSRTAPGVGTDSVIAILEADLPGAIPATIATIQPAVSEVLDIVGFGNQGTASFASWGYIIPTSGDIIGGKAPVRTVDSGDINTRFVANSTQPLIFNATPGDSGGGLFNAQRQLCGTLSWISALTANVDTHSVNLISISPWIQQVTAPYNVPPTLHLQRNGGQVTLTAFNAPISQEAGQWIAQKSTNLVDWTDTVEQFVWNKCVVATSQPHEFYKLLWVPVSPAVQQLKTTQARQSEANLPKTPTIVRPPGNNLLLPPKQ